MTDAIKKLFDLLVQKEKSGSDYTGKVTGIDGNTAKVQFDGSDIPDTPVKMSIGASPGDSVRVRVADGKAWITGNDSAPPNDSADAMKEIRATNAHIEKIETENIVGDNGWINLKEGTFSYGGEALAWNGKQLKVKGVIKSDNADITGKITSSNADITGKVTSSNADITGKVTATSGKFGVFEISSHEISAVYAGRSLHLTEYDDTYLCPAVTLRGLSTYVNAQLRENGLFVSSGSSSSDQKLSYYSGNACSVDGELMANVIAEGGTLLSDKYLLASKIVKTDITGTTSASGAFSLGLDSDTHPVLSVVPMEANAKYSAEVSQTTAGAQWVTIKQATTGALVTGTSVKVRVVYINLP